MSASQAAMESSTQISIWRGWLLQQQSGLQAAFQQDGNAARMLRQHSKTVDRLLCEVWRQSGLMDAGCLIAVGGYGRGELFPYSDVDLLVLLPDKANETVSLHIESMIGLFWDIGLAVGHSVRNLQECMDEAQKDVTVQTNLLEARFLAGNKALYQAFEDNTIKNLDVQKFFEAKALEQSRRHARFNDTASNLEPNVKENPGGLRDLQNILWIASSLNLGGNWESLVKHGLISASEARHIRRDERHLQTLRIRLHYLAKRREDRLLFDFQNDLAVAMGFVTSKRHRASEQLMRSFYRSAKSIILMNDILLQSFKEKVYHNKGRVTPINDHFEARNNLLDVKSSTLLQRHPSLILKSFLILEQYPELEGMSANLLRTLNRVKTLVNRDFRQNSRNKALFLEILNQPRGATKALRLMNRYGILGRYIPAFGRIVGQMQHDLFHVYTVDEHILHVFRNLRRFAVPEYVHEFPLCSKLIAEFEKPYLLYLSALFHDIAKGRGGDHSTLGAADARRFCQSHGLPKHDANLVAWLVQFHLVMSSTAQKADLSDPQVIENFVRLMRDERHLTALYLLTVADIRGTSPKVWNAWKAKLLENLFLAAKRLLQGTSGNTSDEIMIRQKEAKKTLSHYGIHQDAYQALWSKFGQQYFLRHRAQEIAWHTRLLLTHINTEKPVVRGRLSPAGDGIQVMIYMRDQDDLFARICSFFERINYNIAEAKVHTTQHGYALDTFIVLYQSDKNISYRDLLRFIEFELTQKIMSDTPPEPPLKGRISRQVKHMPISASIVVDCEKNNSVHTLEIIASDRPGLLSILAHTLLKHSIHLHMAKINTLGNRAEDTFTISGKNGRKLDEATLNAVRQELLSQL